ncbi:MAG TPA: two-component regulator propeller domain-containing protein, partial [Bacteroidia bacterium]|nr:two-component regulator propeller domain-containing protein [Bacteroidia bacterium]
MRKILSFLFIFFLADISGLTAQNGVSVISMPGFFNPQYLRYKNCIVSDNPGNIWIGTRDVGLLEWDGTSWNYYDPSNGITDYTVNCLLADPNGLLWVGTDTGGVCVFNGATWGNFSAWNSNIPSHRVLCIKKQGTDVWLGTDHGLTKFDGTNWTVYNTQNSGLPSDTVNDIAFSATGEILVATSAGFMRFNNSAWYGLWSSSFPITHLYVHNDGTEWLTTNGHLYKNTTTGFTIIDQLYDMTDPNFDTDIKTIGKGPDGGVAFCSTHGRLNEIYGDRIHTYYPTGLSININLSQGLFCLNSSTNQFWMVNSFSGTTTSPMIDLLLFDVQQYNGLGKGFTADNNKDLDVNNIKAKILNRGDMHWNLNNGCYEVPKGSGKGTAFASALWIAGFDSAGSVHEAAATYRLRGCDYFPGPLNEQTGLTDSASAYKFDRLWKTDQYKISEFQWQFANGNVQNGTYTVPPDIMDWPAIGNMGITQALAPFVDANGNGIYDPLTGGDYPKITGDQEIFWVFNDALAPHMETFGGAKLGVEVQAHAYAFACPDANDSDKAINYTTFYQFDIINRSAMDYNNVMLGFYQDVDLGNYQNDFVGCLPQYNIGFTYNGDSLDPDINAQYLGYHNFTPTQATVVLDGPPAIPGDNIDNNNDGTIDEPGEKNLMTGFIHFSGPGFTLPDSWPNRTSDYLNFLQGKWRDSTSLTFGGNGYAGTTSTKFMYPSYPDDTSGWNENTAGITPSDRNQLISTGSFNFSRGDTIHYVLALVTSFDSTDNWNSHAFYQNMVRDVQKVQQWYTNASTPSCFATFDAVQEHAQTTTSLLLYPNPASDKLTISYEAKNKNASIEIYDISGQRIYSGMWNNIHLMTIPLESYADGIYFV